MRENDYNSQRTEGVFHIYTEQKWKHYTPIIYIL